MKKKTKQDLFNEFKPFIAELFNNWARSQEQRLTQEFDAFKNIETQKRKEHYESMSKHANQVEGYLKGFNSILKKKIK